MPELVLLEVFPLTEVTGAGGLSEEQPASQSETSDNAATRRTVIFGLPALIYPPGIVLTASVLITVSRPSWTFIKP
ncbi:hypothetical protein MXL54_05995 [Enterobacteriaceae bacterium G50]|nr:hypothetical protein [Enterobacteriaceae bacterium G50]